MFNKAVFSFLMFVQIVRFINSLFFLTTMRKIHTRQKRRAGFKSTHLGHKAYFKKKVRANKPKTFKTKEQAEDYAKSKSLKNYSIELVKRGRRWRVVLE